MSVTNASIISRVTTILNDDDKVRWTQTELLLWGTEVQRNLVEKFHDAYTKTIQHPLVAGAKQSVPSDCIAILDVRQNNNGNSVLPCDRKTLDTYFPGWMVSPTSDLVRNWMPDANPKNFYVEPAQNATPATLVLTYAAIPPDFVATGDFALREIYDDRQVNGMLCRAYQKDADYGGNAERAEAYFKLAYGG